MVRRAALFAFLVAVSANASLTLTGSLNTSLARGQQKTLQLTIGSTSAFSDALTLQITTALGLIVKDTRFNPAGWTCQDSTFSRKNIRRCWSPSGTVSIPTGGTVNVDVDVQAGDASLEIPTISVQLVADGGSGTSVLAGEIEVTPGEPKLEVIRFPEALQQTPTLIDSTELVIANVGDAPGSFQLSAGSDFASFSEKSGVIAPHNNVVIDIFGTKEPAGFSETTLIRLTGDFEDPPVLVRLAMYVADAPSGSPKATASATRFDVPSTADAPVAKILFTNAGDGEVRGLVYSDRSFLVPPDGFVTIPPGQSKEVDVAIDKSQLPNASDTNNETGKVTLKYLNGTGAGAKSVHASDNASTSRTSTSVVVTTPGSATSVAGPIAPIEFQTCCNGLTYLAGDAILLPGVAHIFGSVGLFVSDLSVYPNAKYGGVRTFQDVTTYYTPLGSASSASKTVALPAIAPPNVASFGDVTTSVYGTTQQIGTVQLQAPNFMLDLVGANANVFNVSNAAGTYGSSVPAFHAYRSVFGNDAVVLSGLRKDATSHTNIYVQEASGHDITSTIDFYNAAGNVIGTTTVDLPGWSAKQLGSDRVPAGTASATVRVSAGNGSLHSYATPVDEASGDTWVATDWRRVYGYDGTATVIIPVAAALHGLNNTYFKTDASITNAGATPSQGTLRFYNRTGETSDRTITLNPHETKTYTDITTTLFGITVDHAGFLMYLPSSSVPVVLTARNYTVVSGSPATYGTAIPAIDTGEAIFVQTNRDKARIGGLEDASLDTVGSRQGSTFRSNFGLVEVSGQPATVKVTLNYRVGTTRAVVDQSASASYELPAHGWLLVGNMANAILGSNRAAVGDLHNITIEFQVTRGAGKIIPFVSSVDNGTGDSIFRSE